MNRRRSIVDPSEQLSGLEHPDRYDTIHSTARTYTRYVRRQFRQKDLRWMLSTPEMELWPKSARTRTQAHKMMAKQAKKSSEDGDPKAVVDECLQELRNEGLAPMDDISRGVFGDIFHRLVESGFFRDADPPNGARTAEGWYELDFFHLRIEGLKDSLTFDSQAIDRIGAASEGSDGGIVGVGWAEALELANQRRRPLVMGLETEDLSRTERSYLETVGNLLILISEALKYFPRRPGWMTAPILLDPPKSQRRWSEEGYERFLSRGLDLLKEAESKMSGGESGSEARFLPIQEEIGFDTEPEDGELRP